MKTKMFGHRLKRKPADSGMNPGRPYNSKDFERGDENEESYEYVKSKDFPDSDIRNSYGKSKDAPPGYEGKEHVQYRDPGQTRHEIRFPEDEPHMKSNVSRNETHEMEDNYHMGVPNQTKYELENKLKRAHMLMDAPNQQDPKPIRGNPVHEVGYEGEEDASGEEEMGPNDMQMPKESRKKMIVAITKRKMKKGGSQNDSEGEDEVREKKRFSTLRS